MENRSLFTRLFALTLALSVGAALFVFLQTSMRAQSALVAEFEAREEKTLKVAAWLVGQKAPYASVKDFRAYLAELSAQFGMRLTYVSQGKVLAESDVTPEELPQMADHSDRPEIMAATGQQTGKSTRYSQTLGKDMLYVATAVTGAAGLPDGVLRMAAPYSSVREELYQARKQILLTVGVMAACAAVLGLYLVGRMRRALASFSRAVDALASGLIPDKIRVYPGSEFKPLADSFNALSKKLRKNQRTLADTTTQHAAVMENMADAVAVLDEGGVIMTHNPALAAMLPASRELIGRHALETGLGLDVHQAIKACLAEQTPEPRRFQAAMDDQVFADVDLIPYLSARGKRRMILVVHDVTTLKNAERILRNFVINASHQLRTPLTSIQGYAATLLDTPPENPEQARNMLVTVLKRSEEMSQVITSLLGTATPQAEAPGQGNAREPQPEKLPKPGQ